MKEITLVILILCIIFQSGFSINFELPLPTNEQLEQTRNFLEAQKNNDDMEPFLDLNSLNVTQISEMINEIFDSISNISQPIYEPVVSLVVPKTTILPVSGVLKFTDLLLEYQNFAGYINILPRYPNFMPYIPKALNLTISFDKLYVKTSYANLLKLGFDVPDYVVNNGNIELLIEGFLFDLKMDIEIFVIEDVTATIDIDNVKTDLHGIINDELVSDELSRILSDVLVPYLKENADEVNAKLGETLKDLLNAIVEAIIGGII